MENIILDLILNYGFIAVFLLMMLECIFPPIPSEVILLFSGFLIATTNSNLVQYLVASIIGSYLGAVILYILGSIYGEKVLTILKIKKKDIDVTVNYFNSHSNISIFVGRFIPIIRSLISIPAGLSKMNFLTFSIFTIVGTAIWNTVLIFLGYFLKESWGRVVEYFDIFSYLVLIIIVIFAIYFVYKTYLKRKKK